MKRTLSGGTLVFLGALFWSLNSPLVKFIEVDSFLLCGLRAAIAFFALAPFIRPRQLKWNIWMLVYVCSYCALSLSIILVLRITSAPIAIGMQYAAIIWFFLARWISTRTFDRRGFVPVCVIFLGVVLFMCSGSDGASTTGNLIALSESIFFAGITVGSKKAAGTNPLGLTAVGNLFTSVLVLSLFPASTATIVSLTGLEWVIMLILGVVQLGGGYAFYNLGVQRVSPQKASTISLWEMILSPLWVALFLQEYPSFTVLLGFVIILIGMLMDARMAPGQPSNTPAPSGRD